MKTKLSDMDASKIEQKAMLVESKYPGTYYAVDRGGRGMLFISGGATIKIPASQVDNIITEMKDVWDIFKR